MSTRLGLTHALFWITALVATRAIAQDDDVLPPEQVFKYTATADAERVRLKFDVLDGYYLYRARFGFASKTNGVTVGAAEFPKGEVHSDEFFGEQEIYRHGFEIAVPYQRNGTAAKLDLQLKLQGCADHGICYIPQTWTAPVTLPAASAFNLGAPRSPLANTDDILPADRVFVMNARFDKPNELTVAWQIEPGYYLYKDKLAVRAEGNIELGRAVLPEGVPHKDDSFGDVRIFRDYAEIKIPFARSSPDALDVQVMAAYQGCKDDSLCYPPGERTMALVLPATREFPASASAAGAGSEPVSEQDRWAALVTGSWAALIGGFFLGGLGVAFTGCVLPMVPILSSIIVGQGGTVSPRRGFALSLSYVLGMAATYTVAGAIAALVGGQTQALFQKPWILTLFAGMFVLLSLGMFGVYDLQMPSAIQTRLSNLANKQKAGTYAGTAVMGALSSLIVTACVAPVLVGALIMISQTHDVARGSAALFSMSMGMGVPLLVVGASAGFLLPRVGAWMNTVKGAFGFVMLGIAIWLMERVLPGSVTLVMWSVLVFLAGVFLGALEPLPAGSGPVRRVAKGLGVLACLYGALLLIGATLGGERPLEPIPRGVLAAAGNRDGSPAAKQGLQFRQIKTVAALDAALAEARGAQQPVMLDFSADWCTSCKEMERDTFPNAGVIDALKPYLLLRADVTENDEDDQALLSRFKSFGPPTIAFFDRAGTERPNFKLVGFVPPQEFSEHVSKLAAL
ncbi:MAG TPA: protein-disulfide reductase DsbD [Gammaproteobacteria bacterium]|nr:protein-disulfide reductase DsbD [Gammaproteobacteria bacterium]